MGTNVTYCPPLSDGQNNQEGKNNSSPLPPSPCCQRDSCALANSPVLPPPVPPASLAGSLPAAETGFSSFMLEKPLLAIQRRARASPAEGRGLRQQGRERPPQGPTRGCFTRLAPRFTPVWICAGVGAPTPTGGMLTPCPWDSALRFPRFPFYRHLTTRV